MKVDLSSLVAFSVRQCKRKVPTVHLSVLGLGGVGAGLVLGVQTVVDGLLEPLIKETAVVFQPGDIRVLGVSDNAAAGVLVRIPGASHRKRTLPVFLGHCRARRHSQRSGYEELMIHGHRSCSNRCRFD